jgi:UDP-glucuronate 4-epimerase
VASTAQRVLLTGGAGFIGSHLAEAFLRRGSQLAIVDELNDFYSAQRKEENLAEVRRSGTFEFVQADICDKPGLRAIFERFRPDVVVHLAARAGVRNRHYRPITREDFEAVLHGKATTPSKT